MKNPDINSIEPFDPMLGIKGVLSAKQMAADQLALNDPSISPIYGKFNGFPETILLLQHMTSLTPIKSDWLGY